MSGHRASVRRSRRKWRATVLAVALALPLAAWTAGTSSAQSGGTPIPIGFVPGYPQAVAVDSATGTVFAADYNTSTVQVVSEASQSAVIPGGLSVGSNPASLAVDPESGTVYVGELPSQVQVITENPSDAAADTVTATVSVAGQNEGFDGPEGIGILPGATPDTGTVYVANQAGNTVSVVSEATNSVTSTIQIPQEDGQAADPTGVAVDTTTGDVFVADEGDGYVSVISGSSYLGSFPLQAANPDLIDPTGIAADPVTGTVYVTAPAPLPGGSAGTVYVIQENSADPVAATVAAALPMPPYGSGGALAGVPESVAVNPGTGTVFVSNYEGSLNTIEENTADPAADSFSEAVGVGDGNVAYLGALAVDTSAGHSYSATVYVESEQTQDLYPVSFPPPLTPQSISFTAPASGSVGGSATLAATGGGSGNPVVFSVDSSSGAGVCTVSGDTVSYTAAGNCVVNANQAGNASYLAAPQVTQRIAVERAVQSISFAAPAAGTVGGSAALSATGGGSGNPVVFSVDSSSPAGVCTVSGDEVSYTAAGNCVIDANQAGNASYLAAPQVTQTVGVSPAVQPQAITFTAPAGGYSGSSAILSATGGGSGNPVVFSVDSSSPAGVCSVHGDEVSYTAAGNCVIDANQAGNASYLAAPEVTQTITIGDGVSIPLQEAPEAQVGLGFQDLLIAEGGDAPLTWSVASGSWLPPGLTLAPDGDITGIPTLGGTYNVTFAVSDSENPPQTLTTTLQFVISLQGTSGALPGGYAGSPYNQTLPAPTGGIAPYTWTLPYGNLPPGLTLNPGGTITGTPTTAGTYTIYPEVSDSQDPAATYDALFTITIGDGVSIPLQEAPEAQVGLGFQDLLIAEGGDAPLTWSVASGSWLPPGLTLAPDGDITGIPTLGGTYNVTFAVSDSENPPQTLTTTLQFVISLQGTSGALPGGYAGSPYNQTLPAPTGGIAPYTWTLPYGNLPPGLTLNPGGTITGTPTTAGTYTIYPEVSDSQDPAATYDALFTITIGDGTQAISLTAPPTGVAGASATLTATGGASGNPVIFSADPSSGSGVCSVSGDTVSYTAAGSCVIDANQAGNTNYTAAPQVTATITVDQAPAFVLDSPPLTGASGQVYSYTFAASGTPAPVYALAGTAPSWLSISSGTGEITGTPPSGTTSFSYSVTATNAAGAASAGPFTVTVTKATTNADISVALVCPASLTVGGTGTCTLTLANAGPAAAAKIVAALLLPASLSQTACTAGCVRHGNIYTWSLAALASGASAKLSITLKASKAGTGVVLALAVSQDPDPKPLNNLAVQILTIKS
jgi:YVTN family beta-propeller protein